MKQMIFAALGDSITWGFPYGESASWVAALQKKYPQWIWRNFGVNGETLPGMRNRLKDVLAEHPDFCVITGGINDVLWELPLAQSRLALEETFHVLIENKTQPLAGIPVDCFFREGQLDQKVQEIQKMILGVAKAMKIPVLDFRGLSMDCYTDECHPNEKGYGVMALKAEEGLKKALDFF